mmetsp:Transcript_23151/g.33173  ORF Transcript_23151/g.33173 Transcript_23151/m.33173 type:complete len:109 (+) Transcript_23151:126-452(+)
MPLSKREDCSLDCENGGRCTFGYTRYEFDGVDEDQQEQQLPFTNVTQIQGMYCICPEGYTGIDCSVEVNNCGGHHCFHGATCQETELEGGSGEILKYCDCLAAKEAYA